MNDVANDNKSDLKKSGKTTFSGKLFNDVDHFVNKDNEHIFCKYWTPEKTPKAIILVVHGYGEHCARYDRVAEMLNDLGFVVFSQDHVGHGESDGNRCDVKDYNIYLRDLLQHINLMKARYPGLPLYLYGHSMGGALSILLAHHNPGLFKCVVLSSPMITKNAEFNSSIKTFLIRKLSPYTPNIGVAKLDTNHISRNQEQVKKYVDDPLIYHGPVLLRMAYQLFRMTDDIGRILPDITFPHIALHGDSDELCSVVGSKELHNNSKCTDKTLKVYEGCRHELIHEIDQVPDAFLKDIKEWLKERIDE